MLEILQSPSLAEKTTLRIGGRAIAEVVARSGKACEALPETLRRLGGVPHVMGAGSNILARDGELPIVLVRPAVRDMPEVVGEAAGKTLVHAGAGVRMPRLLGFCAEHGLSGLEGLCGIPGTVGGAVAMNAGSYGCETCAAVHSVEIFELKQGFMTLAAREIKYGYRHIAVPGNINEFIILGVTFGLTPAERGGIKKLMAFNFLKKKSTQPVAAHSAGCVFKNPEGGLSAGRLLDQAGLKGKRCGGMAFSHIHANFLVNEGGGSAAAAFDLIAQARESVSRRFGINLELEVRVAPWPSR
ncbi:MAG: UDP-N-acetylmuramate dehydrogenase [Desulfovibrionaceae bacterium]|nr:UDP-N-acetylmuramate dehydrogenase [Desulfovibrionaceae bacterium]